MSVLWGNQRYAKYGLSERVSAEELRKAQRWELGFWAAICGVAALVIAAELIGFLP